jgi:hypothetical protein
MTNVIRWLKSGNEKIEDFFFCLTRSMGSRTGFHQPLQNEAEAGRKAIED